MSDNLRTLVETRLLPYVERPMRYAGGELNCIHKDLSQVSLHGVLCFPDLYDIGMSHTGLQILYHIVNSRTEWALSRCFHPWSDAEARMRSEHIPLYSLEYFIPVAQADFIGFTVQYELQYTNIINMLDLAGLDPRCNHRTEMEPLVIAGGPCVGNPEPLAEFIDVFVIGDGEEAIVHLARTIEWAKKNGVTREELLLRCSEISGVYVPTLFPVKKYGKFLVPQAATQKKITAVKIAEMKDEYYPHQPIVPLIEVVHKRLAVEVMRGCTRGCRFCSAGTYYRPVRERSSDAIRSNICSGIASTGWNEIGLLSLSTADYSSLSSLLQSLHAIERDYPVVCSLPSTRLDALTAGQLDLLEKVSSLSSFTIAPEAGSERLRRVINKDFTDAVIYDAVRELMRRNVQTLKLYFMLGLPTETNEDTDALVLMVEKIAEMVRGTSGRRMVHVALSPFSPKPHTPFQREGMHDTSALLEKSVYIKSTLRYLKNVKVSYRNPDQTMLETIMARGDRRIASLIFEVWRKGARFDGWDEFFDLSAWMTTAADLAIEPAIFLQPFTGEQPLPWSVISTGVSEHFLVKERMRAYEGITTADCRTGECSDCGVCSSDVKPVLVGNRTNEESQTVSAISRNGAPLVSAATVAYRFYYRKSGIIRFLGHLDMVATIHRAAHMAGYSLVYTNGFNPHPRIAFGPPLPFGIGGIREAFDVVVYQELQDDPLRINNWLPEGLHITDYRSISLRERPLNAAIVSVRYNFAPVMPITDDRINASIDSVRAADSLIVTSIKKGAAIEKDIRKGIIDLSPLQTGGGWSAHVLLNGAASCKPAELLNVMFPQMPLPEVYITREACCDLYGEVI